MPRRSVRCRKVSSRTIDGLYFLPREQRQLFGVAWSGLPKREPIVYHFLSEKWRMSPTTKQHEDVS